jgi:hypothetical protein
VALVLSCFILFEIAQGAFFIKTHCACIGTSKGVAGDNRKKFEFLIIGAEHGRRGVKAEIGSSEDHTDLSKARANRGKIGQAFLGLGRHMKHAKEKDYD